MKNILIVNNKKYGGGAQSVFRENISSLKKEGLFNVYEGSSDKSSDLNLKLYKKNILGYFFSGYNYLKTYRFLNDNKINIIHIHQYFGLSFGFLLAVKKYKFKKKNVMIVYTSHTYNLVCPNHSLYDNKGEKICERCIGRNIKAFMLLKKCCKGNFIISFFRFLEGIIQNNILKIKNIIDYYVVPSQFLKEKLIEDGISSSDIFVAYNSLNESFQSNKPLEKKENLICYYGRFSEEKNLFFMLKGIKQIFERHPDYKLILIGEGPLASKIYIYIKKLGIEDKVILRKFLSQKELQDILNKVKITLMPSKVYETFGLTILESIACNCIPITIDKGALNELIERLKCGKTYRYEDIEDFIKVISSIIENYSLEIAKLKENKTKIDLNKNRNIIGFYNGLRG